MLRVGARDFKKSRRTLVHGPEPRSSWKVCWFGGMRVSWMAYIVAI